KAELRILHRLEVVARTGHDLTLLEIKSLTMSQARSSACPHCHNQTRVDDAETKPNDPKGYAGSCDSVASRSCHRISETNGQQPCRKAAWRNNDRKDSEYQRHDRNTETIVRT